MASPGHAKRCTLDTALPRPGAEGARVAPDGQPAARLLDGRWRGLLLLGPEDPPHGASAPRRPSSTFPPLPPPRFRRRTPPLSPRSSTLPRPPLPRELRRPPTAVPEAARLHAAFQRYKSARAGSTWRVKSKCRAGPLPSQARSGRLQGWGGCSPASGPGAPLPARPPPPRPARGL